MSLIPFRKFRASDLAEMLPTLIDDETRNLDKEVVMSWAEYNERLSVGYTACIDGVPIMAAGIRYKRPGVGEAWFYMTEEGTKHKLSILRSSKLMFGFILEACDYKKIIASVRHDLKGADVTVRHFGFRRVRKMLGGKRDYYLLKV